MYTPFAHAFAYAIKQTPYAFVAKIILWKYLIYGVMSVAYIKLLWFSLKHDSLTKLVTLPLRV